jgi:hypothetical protein
MSIIERSEMLSQLYKVQAELAVLYQRSLETRAVSVGVYVSYAQNNVKDAIAEFRPDSSSPLPSNV